MQTTPVKRPTGDLCLAEHLCVEAFAYAGFLGRRNVSRFRRLKQSTLILEIVVASKTGVTFHATRSTSEAEYVDFGNSCCF